VYPDGYGHQVFGAVPQPATDLLDTVRLVPPVFVPYRMDKLIELGREPTFRDVALDTVIGGFVSSLPLYVSAFGSTRAGTDLAVSVSRQAARLRLPMVIGENVAPMNGYGRLADDGRSMLRRVRAYVEQRPDEGGGVVVQQSTEDADAEVWNLVYSDPGAQPLLESGRLAFELKVGQGAKPGLGGMTLLDSATAAAVDGMYTVDDESPAMPGFRLRHSSPGTFTEEILRQQIRLMRNNYPRAKVWVKLPPARDVAHAAATAWEAGADAVTVDGAEGGTGWAPNSFLANVGLPLAECLQRLDPAGCLLVSGRMWEGTRVVKALAHGATAAGLGRAALIAADEDPEEGLVRFVQSVALELRLLISALGKYTTSALDPEDLWWPERPADRPQLLKELG
jgi:hypothetical protein